MTAVSPTSLERMIEPELLITGEAVALEITPVTVANRIISGLIDYAARALGVGLSVVVVMVLAIFTGLEFRGNLVLTWAMLSPALLVWMVVTPLLVKLLSGGRSLGRTVTGARVVRDDGGTIRLCRCLVRTLLAVVEIWSIWAVPAPCVSTVPKRGKRFGDMLAGIYVIREHHRSHMVLPLLMPPELTQWAVGTDLRALPGNLSLTACTFLRRAPSLVLSSRHQLGLELAPQVQGYVSPLSPAGVRPERFPVAVLTERRNHGLVPESRDRWLEENVLRDMVRPPYGAGEETRRR